MSRLNSKSSTGQGLGHVVQKLATAMRETPVTSTHTRSILGLEGLDDTVFNSIRAEHSNLERVLSDIWKDSFSGVDTKASFGIENLGELNATQLEAGAIIMGANGAIADFARAAYTNQARPGNGVDLIDSGYNSTGIESYLEPSLEAFDEQELKNHLGWSVAFNVLGARQDEFSERFFPTVVVTPDQAGLDMTIRRTMVLTEMRHTLDGKPQNLDKRNLVEAVIDYTVLKNEANRIYPMVVASGADANTTYYVASGDVAPYNIVTDGGQVVLTAPLKMGITIGLLGLAQRNDIQTQGQFNSTDNLDIGLRLQKIYLKVVSAADGTSVIPIDVSRVPRNQWNKAVEGRGRALNLNFSVDDLPLSGTTKQLNGNNAAALNYLRAAGREDWTVRIGVDISGNADVEQGTINANPSAVRIVGIWEADGNGGVNDITATELANLATALGTMTIIGYDVYATRCNSNLRTRGMLLNSVDITERYSINLGAPITIPSPVTANRDAGDLAALINAVRIRNSNNAVTTLLNHASALEQLQLSTSRLAPIPAIEGIGRYVVRPFYEKQTIDLTEHINSIKSHERAEDVRAALVNVIREVAYRAYRDSGYQAALDALTGCSGERPIVLVGTDPVISKYLWVEGDTRTLGIGLQSEVVFSLDARVYNKIFVTLTRASQVGADPLCFGQFAWVPELAATVQVSRGGATTKEAIVQPRSRHITNLPILIEIDVSGLKEAVADTTVYKTYETNTHMFPPASYVTP